MIDPQLLGRIQQDVDGFEAWLQTCCSRKPCASTTGWSVSAVSHNDINSRATLRYEFEAMVAVSLAYGYLDVYNEAVGVYLIRERGFLAVGPFERGHTHQIPARLCATCPNLLACTLEGTLPPI